MSMERDKCFFLFLSLSLLHSSLSLDFPSQGCYWTDTCLHKSKGDCGGLVYNQSSNCHGHCQSLKCPPYYTHFYCCLPGSPKEMKDGCKKCDKKVDNGDEFVCCDDCTYPQTVYNDYSLGYCTTGAEFISEPKPKEVFKWVVGAWLPCSSTCGGGVRSRSVDCFAVVKETASPDYLVYDDQCSDQQKADNQEPCNLQSCVDDIVNPRRRRTSRSKIVLLVFLAVTIVGAIAFAGFIFHTRKTSSQQGYVYINMGEF